MVCPFCGTENPNPVGYCSACNRMLPNWNIVPPAPSTPPVWLTSRALSLLGILCIPAIIALAAYVAYFRPMPPAFVEADAGVYRMGFLIGMLALPILLASILLMIKKTRYFNLFAMVFCCVGFLMAAGNVLVARIEPKKEHITRVFREASGLQPIRNPLFCMNPDYDGVMRDIFRDVLQINQNYVTSEHNLDTSEVHRLTEPRGFADPSWAAKGLKQVHTAYEMDAAQEANVQAWIVRSRQKISDLLANSAARERELRDFDESIAGFMPSRQGVSTAEKAWIDSIDDLYLFAQKHHSEMTLKNGKVMISSQATLDGFRKRAELMDTRYQEYSKALEQFQQKQKGMLEKEGVTRKELGIREP